MNRLLLILLLALGLDAGEIAHPAPRGASLPYLATTDDGALAMSWLEPASGKGGALKLAILREGRWSRTHTIVQRPDLMINWANSPSLLAAGPRLYAQWVQSPSGGGHAADVYVASSADEGATWSKSQIIHRDGKAVEHGFVSMAALGGDAAVAWLDGREMTGHDRGEMTLRYARLSGSGALSAEALLDRRVCECCGTGMAMTAAGPIVAYRDRSPGELRDISVVRWSGGRWSAPATVHADRWKIDGCPLNGPQIDALGKRVVVGWFTGAAKPRVNVAFSSDGGATFAKPIVVSTTTAGRVELLVLPEGDALAFWLDGLGEKASIAGRRVSSSGQMGEIVRLGPTTGARSSGFPRAALSGKHAYVAWTDPVAKRVRLASLPAE